MPVLEGVTGAVPAVDANLTCGSGSHGGAKYVRVPSETYLRGVDLGRSTKEGPVVGTRISTSDLTWLLMDSPSNLMHVHGLVTFGEMPDWEQVNSAVFERLVTRYRVLTQHPVHKGPVGIGHWEWEDDTDFDLRRHLRRIELADSSPETLHAHLSSYFSVPFDRDHPLWEMQLLTGPADDPDAPAYLFSRFHHALGDGIRLVQLIIGLCDPVDGAIPQVVGRRGEHHSTLETAVIAGHQAVADTVDYVKHALDAASGLGGKLVATLNPLNLPHTLESVVDLVRHPVKITDALTSVASDNNEWTNSVREVSRVLLTERAETGLWHGHASGDKAIDWLSDISFDDVRAVARHYDGTINDTLMSVVSLALTAYLVERGIREVHDLGWLMPVSLQPVDPGLPATLGNYFSVVLFSMPLGIEDPGDLIAETHRRTERIKHSIEPVVTFGVQRAIAESPGPVAKAATGFFAGKTIGQLTNVPGPRTQMALVGAPVRSMLGWVPMQGDQPLGVCLFSYNGTINIGVAADTALIPDVGRLTSLLRTHIDDLVATVEAEIAAEGEDDPGPEGKDSEGANVDIETMDTAYALSIDPQTETADPADPEPR